MQETDSQSQEQATATKAASAPAKSRTLWGDAFKRLRKNKLAVIGVCWIIIVVLVALTADLWAQPWLGSPTASDSTTMAETSLLAPCAEHPFGTDSLGRDILVRVIYGARVSLSVGIMATAISTVIGLVMGALAGFYGGIWDTIIMGSASISLWAGSAFLLFLLVSAIGHYQLLTRSADTYSLKESGAMLKKQLERRINIDFIIYLIFFYGTAVRFVIQYFNDYEGLKGLTFILMLFTGILLAIPWLMRYQQKHRYRYYFNSLDKSQKLLEVSE